MIRLRKLLHIIKGPIIVIYSKVSRLFCIVARVLYCQYFSDSLRSDECILLYTQKNINLILVLNTETINGNRCRDVVKGTIWKKRDYARFPSKTAMTCSSCLSFDVGGL
jgi:hypothetical protein